MRPKRIALWLIPVLMLISLAYLFGYSDLLQVKSIEFSGSANRQDVQNILNRPEFNIKVGAKLARINIRGAQSAISKIGWVAKSTVMRDWFSGTVRVMVISRTPVAILNTDGQNSYIDPTGVIYQDLYGPTGLPLITIEEPILASKAATFITNLPPSFLKDMESLYLSRQGIFDMELKFSNRTVLIRWGSGEDLATKTRIYEKLIALSENKNFSAIDLSDPKYPIVKN